MNWETPLLLAYRNQPGKMIIVYDDVERLAPRVAATLVERGYDNVYLLSGGLKMAYQKYRSGLITGTVPPSVLAPTPSRRTSSRPGTRSGSMPPTPNARRKTPQSPQPAQQPKQPQFQKRRKSAEKTAVASGGEIQDYFLEQDLQDLRTSLQHNLLPRAARTRAMAKSTASTATRSQLVKSASRPKDLPVHKPWIY